MYDPKPEHKFTFGLWTIANQGRDPFGEPVRAPMSPVNIVHLLAEVGAWGVNFHDNDLVPIDATPASGIKLWPISKKRSTRPAWLCRWPPPISLAIPSSGMAHLPAMIPRYAPMPCKKR